jgi:hypothetical protein
MKTMDRFFVKMWVQMQLKRLKQKWFCHRTEQTSRHTQATRKWHDLTYL